MLLISASIQLGSIIKNWAVYTFSMEDILITFILILYLVFYCLQIYVILKNYAALKKKKSKATRGFGILVEDIDMKNQSKIVVLLTSLSASLENLCLTWVLVCAYDKPWLQLIVINFWIEFKGIFFIYFRPYRKDSEKQIEVEKNIKTDMLFNYSMFCLSNFV